MSRCLIAVLVLTCGLTVAESAAQPATDPLALVIKRQFEGPLQLVLESTQKMPADNFSFRPTPEVRSFGEVVGHVVLSAFLYCSASLGEPIPQTDVDLQSDPSKADLLSGLTAAQRYCEKAYSVTDEELAQSVPQRGVGVRAQALIINASHTYEHYGNLVTYMRLKGMVPPSTERAQQRRERARSR